MPRPVAVSLVAAALVLGLAVFTGARQPGSDAGADPPQRDARASEAELPGRYIVTYAPAAGSPVAETATRERRQGFEAEHVYGRAVEGFAAELSPGQVARLEADPEVAAVVPDRRIETTGALAPGEPVPPAGVRRVGPASKRDARGASGARVAVIDTGVDLDHPDLDVASGANCVSPATRPRTTSATARTWPGRSPLRTTARAWWASRPERSWSR